MRPSAYAPPLSRSVSPSWLLPDQAGHCECSAIRRARLLEMLQHLRAQRGLRIRAPRAKALARFEAELALRYQRFEIGRGPAAVLDIGQHRLVNRQRQIGADKIGILERTQDREPPAEARLDHGVHDLGVANAA